MESPNATLAEEAIGLDRALLEAAASLDPGRLREMLDGLEETALIELVRSSSRLANLADAIGSAAAGEFAGRSARGHEESLAKRLGERSAPLAVAALGRVSVRRAAEWVTVGQALAGRRSLVGERLPDAHPEIAAALDSGAIGAEAADLIVDTLRTIAPKRDADQLAADEVFLVQSALMQTTQGLGRICKSYVAHADPDGVAEREADLVAKAGTRVIQRRSGMVVILTEADPESAGYILTAIDARTAPKREVRFRTDEEEQDDTVLGDDRSLARRRLDALVSIARDAIRRDDGAVGGISAKVIVTIDHEALLTGIGSATIAGVDQPICAATARRIACDALILPAVLGGKSQVLDFGRGGGCTARTSGWRWWPSTAAAAGDRVSNHGPMRGCAREGLASGHRQRSRPHRGRERHPALPLPPPTIRQRRLGAPVPRRRPAPDPAALDRPRPVATTVQIGGAADVIDRAIVPTEVSDRGPGRSKGPEWARVRHRARDPRRPTPHRPACSAGG